VQVAVVDPRDRPEALAALGRLRRLEEIQPLLPARRPRLVHPGRSVALLQHPRARRQPPLHFAL